MSLPAASRHPIPRPLRALVTPAGLTALAALAVRVGAQPPGQLVTGRVTIAERAGVRTADLADAVVWLEPAGDGGGARGPVAGGPGASTGGEAPAQIAMRGRSYVPRVRVVRAGSTVEFPNHDPFRHNVFSKTGPMEFDLGLYERGASRAARLTRAGVYPVFCDIHARMSAFVVAVASPWVAQPAADGRFALAAVPPGRYLLRVWHERGGEHARPVVVGDATPAPADTAELAVQLDARAYRHRPHLNKFGQPYARTSGERY